jgi:CRISPR-associated endonuclease/helicase Cas3
MRSLPDVDPLDLAAMRRYFELLYDVQELDKKQIMRLLNPEPRPELFFPFKEAAQAFRFIEEESIGVIVATEPEAKKLVKALRYTEFTRSLMRRLQQYSVAVRPRGFAALKIAGALEIIHDEFPVLYNAAAYRDDVGLCVEEGEVWNVEDLIK